METIVKNKHVIIAVLTTYVIVSMVPSLGLMQLLGKAKGKNG